MVASGWVEGTPAISRNPPRFRPGTVYQVHVMAVSPLSSTRSTPAVTLGTIEKCGEARSGGGLVELEGIRGFFLFMENIMESDYATEGLHSQGNKPNASWANIVEESEKNQTTNPIEQINTVARFFFIKRTEGSFEKTSPFLIHKSMQSCIGEVKNIKKMRSGDILVEVADAKQSEKLQKLTKFAYHDVIISPHNSLNISRGVISEPDLLYSPEEEIVNNLENQNVSHARRITIKRDGKILPTKHIILTFKTPKVPSYITAGYLKCPVRPYIPNPLRCFQCQRYGHSKNSCRGTLTCARCAIPGHSSENCQESPKCVNCKENHPSYAKSCPKWKIEKEIQTVRVNQNLSYQEARRLVETRTPQTGLSYAAASASKITKTIHPVMRSIAIQTDTPYQISVPQLPMLKSQPVSTHIQPSVSNNAVHNKRSGNKAPPTQSKKNTKKKSPITKLDSRLKMDKSSFYKSKATIDQKSLKRKEDETDEISLSASDLSDDLMEDAASDTISVEKASPAFSKFFR